MYGPIGKEFLNVVAEPKRYQLLHLGTVIDPVNLKPEIATVFLIHELALVAVSGNVLNPSYETQSEGIDYFNFDEANLEQLMQSNLLVPTGRALLRLVFNQIKEIRNALADI